MLVVFKLLYDMLSVFLIPYFHIVFIFLVKICFSKSQWLTSKHEALSSNPSTAKTKNDAQKSKVKGMVILPSQKGQVKGLI
jgi:hypothetical protein